MSSSQLSTRNSKRASSPGRPLTQAQLVARLNKWRDQYNPLRSMSVARAVSLCEAYPRGDMADLQWTYFHIEQADPDLFTLCERRTSSILEMDWNISIVPEQRRSETFDEALAAEQKAALREAYDRVDNLYEGIEHFASASFRGFSHAEKFRTADGDINHLEIVDQWNIVRDGLRGAWKYNPEGRSTSFPSLPAANLIDPTNFVIREVRRHINHVALKKFVRTSLGEKDWTAFLEIYGIPSGVVIMPPNIPAGKESEYESAAEKIAEGGNGALPNGSDYKANDAARGVDPFSPFLRYFTEKLVLVGTGGLLTMLTQSGSGTLAGNAHMEAFRTIARGEARKINECLQRSIDAEVLKKHFEGKPALAYFELKFNQETSVADLADQAQKFSAAGYQLDPDELTEKTGYTITLKAQPTADAAQPGDADPQSQISDLKSEVPSRFANRATSTLAGLIGAREDWLAPVARMFEDLEAKANSGQLSARQYLDVVEATAKSMPELLNRMDTKAIATALQASMEQALAQSSADSLRSTPQVKTP